MNDERQDPELEVLRREWDAPPPGAGFDSRVVAAYRSEFSRRPRWAWPMAIAFAAAAMIVVVLVYRPRAEPRYRPVSAPHFYVVSAGEHP
jgi:hypothetical protein